MTSLAENFWSKVEKTSSGCWLYKGQLLYNGYGNIGFRGKTLLAHRLAYELQIGEIPTGMLVCHRCDVRNCVRGDHLFAGTALDNENDKIAKSRNITGSRHKNSKLTEADVVLIRKEKLAGLTLQCLAEKFSVSKKLVLLITQRKVWKHVP